MSWIDIVTHIFTAASAVGAISALGATGRKIARVVDVAIGALPLASSHAAAIESGARVLGVKLTAAQVKRAADQLILRAELVRLGRAADAALARHPEWQ